MIAHRCPWKGKMTYDEMPDLSRLDYDPHNFRDLFETDLGQAVWAFMKRADDVVRMETATYLNRAAVEPLAPGLLRLFGPEIAQDRLKQMIGHMARQVMEAIGLELDRHGMRITRSIFTTATRYKDPNNSRGRAMFITPEQRRAWMEKTAASPFNKWLDSTGEGPRRFVQSRTIVRGRWPLRGKGDYRHLNAGQQRMNIGIQLRKVVPKTEYEAA